MHLFQLSGCCLPNPLLKGASFSEHSKVGVSGGTVIDTSSWWEGPRKVEDDTPVGAAFLGLGKQWADLRPRHKRRVIKGPQHGTTPELCVYVSGHVSLMLTGRSVIDEGGGGKLIQKTYREPKGKKVNHCMLLCYGSLCW